MKGPEAWAWLQTQPLTFRTSTYQILGFMREERRSLDYYDLHRLHKFPLSLNVLRSLTILAHEKLIRTTTQRALTAGRYGVVKYTLTRTGAYVLDKHRREATRLWEEGSKAATP